MLRKIIKNVLELPGVDGACILDKKGNLLHNALPEFFMDDFLDDLSRRVTALYEAVDENYVPCDDYLLKFPQKYIQLRRSRNVYLLVCVDPSVNLVSLRMVTNMVLKHITPKTLNLLRAAQAEQDKALHSPSPEPSIAPVEVTVPPAKPAAVTAPTPVRRAIRPRPTRSFRGTNY